MEGQFATHCKMTTTWNSTDVHQVAPILLPYSSSSQRVGTSQSLSLKQLVLANNLRHRVQQRCIQSPNLEGDCTHRIISKRQWPAELAKVFLQQQSVGSLYCYKRGLFTDKTTVIIEQQDNHATKVPATRTANGSA